MLEGILGLWLWSLKTADDFHEKGQQEKTLPPAENPQMARIVWSPGEGEGSQNADDFGAIEDELGLWLGQDRVKLQRGKFQYQPSSRVPYPSGLWASSGQKSESTDPRLLAQTQTPKTETLQSHYTRFFGWQSVPLSIKKEKGRDGGDVIHVLYRNSTNNLLTECCQDLYSALLVSLAKKIDCNFDGATVSGTASQIRLEDPKISAMITAFTENSLGSRSDAVLCIIPGLRKHIKLRNNDSLQSSLTRVLGDGDGENGNAEVLLNWIHSHSKESERESSSITNQQVFASNLITVCESYRMMFAGNQPMEVRHSGYRKLQRIIKKYRPKADHGGGEGGKILERYGVVARQTAIGHEDTLLEELPYEQLSEVPEPANLDLVIGNKKRTETLYLPSKVSSELLRTELEAALPLASRNGWDEITKALLRLGALVDGQNEEGRTALSYYCERPGSVSMVKTLLDSGAHPDLPDPHKCSPLGWAARIGDREIVKALRDTGKVLLDSVDNQGRSPLCHAAQNNQREVVRMLRDSGLVELDLTDTSGRTPFSYAAEKGYVAIVEDLMNYPRVGVDTRDVDGRTPCSWAAGNGQVQVVEILSAMHTVVDVNSKDSQKKTPLRWAAENGHVDVVKKLYENKRVDSNARDIYGLSALARAAQVGSESIVEALLCPDSGVDILIADDMGRTALWWALRGGHLTTAEILLRHTTFDAGLRDDTGRTPLWWAAHDGHEPIAGFLLNKGADPAARDLVGQTPLWCAVRNGHTDIVRLLLETGRAEPDARGSVGRTPLMWAARRGDLEVVGVLLETGKVNVAVRDDAGRSALSWALGAGHSHVVEALYVASGRIEKESRVEEVDFEGRVYKYV